MVLISSLPIKSSQSFGDFHVSLEPDSGWILEENKLIFKGAFWTEKAQEMLDLFAHDTLARNSMALRSVDSIFAVASIDEGNNTIKFANDRYGFKTLYIYSGPELDGFVLSDSFRELQNHIPLGLLEPDTHGIAEFLLFNYPLFGRTFLKNVCRVAMGTIGAFRDNRLVLNRYWSPETVQPKTMHIDMAMRKLNRLLNEAITLIHQENSASSYGLGLSGGLDSRIVAALSVEQGLNLQCFVFGEPGSDSFRVSSTIAKELGLNLSKLRIDSSFYLRVGTDVIVPNPMINLITSWPLTSCSSLPAFNKLLTGFNGDNMLGSHIRQEDLTIEIGDVTRTAKRIMAKYGENGTLGDVQGIMRTAVCTPILTSMSRYVQQYKHLEPWRIIERFNFANRQLAFIKSNPLFHLTGRESVSPFTYPPFVDFSNSLDVSKRLDMLLYRKYIISRFPGLAGIRAERTSASILTNPLEAKIRHWITMIERVVGTSFLSGRSHKKNLVKTARSRQFFEFILDCLEWKNDRFEEVFDANGISLLLKKLQSENKRIPIFPGRQSSHKVMLIFALLTVKLWFDSLFK